MIFPPIWVAIVIILTSFLLLFVVFHFNLNSTLLGYISFPYATYGTVIICSYFVRLWKLCKNKLSKEKHLNLILNDKEANAKFSLLLSFVINTGFIVFKSIMAYRYKSFWFIEIASYYALLWIMKIVLISEIRKNLSYKNKLKIYILIGGMLFILHTIMTVLIRMVIVDGRGVNYSGSFIYVVAIYSFYSIITAIKNIFRFWEGDPLLSAAKFIKFSSALMSLLLLQTAMIDAFGSGKEFRETMTGVTGRVVSILSIGISIYMIINGIRKLKVLDKEC